MNRILLILSILLIPAVGQDFNATLRGTVQDASGGRISGATIEITSAEKGTTRKSITNTTGEYIAAQLPAQTYIITVSYPGFQTQVRKDYTLQVGQESRLNFIL